MLNMTGDDIKQARKTLGLTQPQLAQVMGYSNKSYISAMENGTRSMSEQGQKLLQAYLSGWRPDDWPELN